MLITLVSAAVLFLAFLAFGAYDRATVKNSVRRNRSIEAQMAGTNSISAILFDDPQAAETTLSALRASPNVLSADIYTTDGRSFARYRRDSASPAPTFLSIPDHEVEASRITNDEIALTRRVIFQGKEVGRVAIRSDVRELARRRTQYLVIGAIVMLASLISALLISWLAQRTISAAIVELAGTVRRVSTEKDYSIRSMAVARTHEIWALVESFNEMLSEIQQRDRSLSQAHDELESRVRERTTELHEANRELEAFSYSVSHDLRAPLRHVSGFATLLEERAAGQLDGESRDYLQRIVAAANKMGQLIDDLLSFSRTGRSPLTKRRVNLGDVVREARQDVVAGPSERRDINWQIRDLPDVYADPAMLRQVMVNLLSNALKYSSPRPVAEIEVGVDRNGDDSTVVFVRDNGVGFDQRYADKLFGVFQRLHSSDDFEGTGIGLANVRRIINRHGGRVWAKSELDRGATFYFSIPVQEST